MALHLVRVDSVTGAVLSEWQGEGDPPTAPAGSTFIDVTAAARALGSYSGVRYAGNVFVPRARRIVSRSEFLRLFTKAERLALRTAIGASSDLADWWELLQAVDTVSLDHPDVAIGLAALQTAGILTSARVTAIASATPPA